MKGFLIGLGVVSAIMLMLYPEIKNWRQQPQPRHVIPESDARRFERQASAAQDVTATEEDERNDQRQAQRDEDEEERISRSKIYKPPDSWRWPYEAATNVDCEPLPSPPWEACYSRYEEPIGGYQEWDRRHQRPRRRQPQQRWVYGPSIRGPDGRMHRTRMAAGPGISGPYGGCQYGEC